MDQGAIVAGLQAALLTDGEIALGRRVWRTFPDPIDSWDVAEPEEADA
jgi:hypothetical protein